MKTTGFRSFVLYIILAILLGGLTFLVYKVATEGSSYINRPYNGHIYAGDNELQTGEIYDRNNLLLAKSDGNARIYSDDPLIRTSLLHTVGDSSGYISTSIQASLRSQLVGYNIFTGLNQIPSDYLGNKDITLTIDSNLNKVAYQSLNGKNGAILVSNYKTGEILCKVSAPTYDPMNIPEDLSSNEIYEGVFLDHTISSSYTLGSVFKLIVTACAIENMPDWESKTYTCEHIYDIDGSYVSCLGTHGEIGIHEALGHSCNIFFAKLALELGSDKLTQTAEEMGFNKSFSFDSFSTSPSNLDITSADDVELAWAGVGQYTVTANPAHMLTMVSAIANNGVAKPLVLSDTVSFTDIFTSDIKLLNSDTANVLKTLMNEIATDYYGDIFAGFDFCAKTGTAEVDGQKPNSWIVGFCKDEKTPYAFSVMVENSSGGIVDAAPIVKNILEEIKKSI